MVLGLIPTHDSMWDLVRACSGVSLRSCKAPDLSKISAKKAVDYFGERVLEQCSVSPMPSSFV